MSNALAATATMISTNGTVTLALTSGERYTTKDSNGFLGRLDRKLGNDGWKRSGYRLNEGVMTASATRTQQNADFVASR